MSKWVAERLKKLARLHESKDAEYDSSYKKFGAVLTAFFPDGITLKGKHQFGRFAILTTLIAKMHRYSQNFDKGGHDDSLDDISIYAVMLRDLDSDD